MKIGIRISVYDDHDNEIRSVASWIPEGVDLSEWRSAYDDLCAALWLAVGELVSTPTLQAHPTPSTPPTPLSATGVSQ